LRHSGSTLYIRLGKSCQWGLNRWEKGMVGGSFGPLEFERYPENRTGHVPALDRNQRVADLVCVSQLSPTAVVFHL